MTFNPKEALLGQLNRRGREVFLTSLEKATESFIQEAIELSQSRLPSRSEVFKAGGLFVLKHLYPFERSQEVFRMAYDLAPRERESKNPDHLNRELYRDEEYPEKRGPEVVITKLVNPSTPLQDLVLHPHDSEEEEEEKKKDAVELKVSSYLGLVVVVDRGLGRKEVPRAPGQLYLSERGEWHTITKSVPDEIYLCDIITVLENSPHTIGRNTR